MSYFISAVILAAGSSHRLGKTKQLLPLDESTFLEIVIDNVLNSSVRETIVVLGHRAEEITRLISGRPVTVVINPDYHQGMSTSISAGLSRVNQEAQGVIFILADQPLVDGKTIDRLIEHFGRQDNHIIIPVYQGKRGNPVLFTAAYKDELMQLGGDTGGRIIIAQYPDRILEVPVSCEGVVIDIDDWDSYQQVTEKLKRKRDNKTESSQ